MGMVAVFDSGVGGLSVLRALRAEMPQGDFVYLADSAHAPYGERGEAWVSARCAQLADWLGAHYPIDALVVACNTATAAAIDGLRQRHTHWPIVGVEPGLKPAMALTRTGHVGVMATRGTLQSQRFGSLSARLQALAEDSPVHWHLRACDGLADAIERDDGPRIEALCHEHWAALTHHSHGAPIDVLVLGCTHYPFASPTIRQAVGPAVTLLDTGPAVARHTRLRLGLDTPRPGTPAQGMLTLLTTGSASQLDAAAHRWIHTPLGMAQRVQTPPPEAH